MNQNQLILGKFQISKFESAVENAKQESKTPLIPIFYLVISKSFPKVQFCSNIGD